MQGCPHERVDVDLYALRCRGHADEQYCICDHEVTSNSPMWNTNRNTRNFSVVSLPLLIAYQVQIAIRLINPYQLYNAY